MTITLSGCEPRPMAGYLKALGVFRILATQADPKVTAYWKDGGFVLSLSREGFDEAALVRFFRDEYVPTPFVAPWNGGSGFFPNDEHDSIERILGTRDKRFLQYAKTIAMIQEIPEIPRAPKTIRDIVVFLNEMGSKNSESKKGREFLDLAASAANHPKSIADALDIEYVKIGKKGKKNTKSKDSETLAWYKKVDKALNKCLLILRKAEKKKVISACRARLPDETIEWLDAVAVLSREGTLSFSSILALGGIDGRLDFSANFMRQVVRVLLDTDTETCSGWIHSSLFGGAVQNLPVTIMGLFAPGTAGGANQGTGVKEENLRVNPWEYVLLMEGFPLFAAAAAGRDGIMTQGASAPFSVEFSRAGFDSEGKGEGTLNETWLPIWNHPSTFAEIGRIFAEGRACVGRRPARTGTDFARAVSTLGVDRGIASFERYVCLQRRGLSHIAYPAGTMDVRLRPKVSRLSDTDEITSSLDGFVRKLKSTPAALEEIMSRIEHATFRCAQFPEPRHFGDLIRAYGCLEKYVALQNSPEKKPDRPFGGTLSPEWIGLCDDGTPEIRLAASLASITSSENVGTIRTTLCGVDADNPRSWGQNAPLRRNGASFPNLLAGLLSRRLLDADRLGVPGIPLKADLAARIEDVMLFLRGETDDDRIEEYLWGFLWIRRPGTKKHGEEDDSVFRSLSKKWNNQPAGRPFSRLYGLFKLLHHPTGPDSTVFKREPRILPLLTAGRTDEALDVAVRRLCISGLKPLPLTIDEAVAPVRLAASLAFPLDNQAVQNMAKAILALQEDENVYGA